MTTRARQAIRLLDLVACVVILTLAALWLSDAFGREPISGPVVAVHDGDTLRIGPHTVRLANIDAPELAQDGGQQARAALVNICAGQWARATVVDVDRYRRLVALVTCGQTDANRVMVAAGHAWVFSRYNRDVSLPGIEAQARAARVGLWAADGPVPPWVWRAGHRAAVVGGMRG